MLELEDITPLERLKNAMVITQLSGGLGNQLFEYAFGRYLANKHQTELKLDGTYEEHDKLSHHNFYKLSNFNIQESFATPNDIKKCIFVAEKVTVFMPQMLDCPDNVIIKGCWHSYKYFEGIEDILRHEFTLKNPLGKVSDFWRKKILSTECAVSMHVRRGDYITPIFRNHAGIIPPSYYIACINELKKSIPNFSIFVFSDEIDWVKNNIKIDVPMEFVQGCEHDYEEMYLMSLCKHNIIANSTFAWWGAWLNNNLNKKVFVPNPWHRDGWGGNTVTPDDWIKIGVDYEQYRPFAPTISVIIYVENYASKIQTTINSVFSQQINDFEAIIVDASTDGSEAFCRKFATRNNVTFVKASSNINKYAAWNIGLNCARGDYMLFLTGEDFVAQNTVVIPCKTLSDEFNDKYNKSNESYMDYAQFVKIKAWDIIGTVQHLSDDIKGSIKFNGAKFSIKSDVFFQNYNDISSFQFNGNFKAILIATEQINNFIGTKFFKRSFLIDNKIRFDENVGADTELLFLINAFMHTNNINFVPYAFYGHLN